MKTILIFFFIGLVSPIFSQTTKTMGDGIPGLDIKVGRKPPGGGTIIASGVTDANGIYELKDVETDGFTYYVRFGIREKGIKAPNTIYQTADYSLVNNNKSAGPIIIKEKHGDYEIVIEISNNGGVINADKNKGPISTSRSNIKVRLNKSIDNIK
jgi:hypothetical protein